MRLALDHSHFGVGSLQSWCSNPPSSYRKWMDYCSIASGSLLSTEIMVSTSLSIKRQVQSAVYALPRDLYKKCLCSIPTTNIYLSFFSPNKQCGQVSHLNLLSLGCNIPRLREYIDGFYASHASLRQYLDDSYYTFVWSLLVQHTSIRIGLSPEEQSSSVYFPPLPRAKKPGNSSGPDGKTGLLGLEPDSDATIHSLQELVDRYGERLRVAVDSATCFEAVTGHHTRVRSSSHLRLLC